MATFERHVDVDWTGSVMEGKGEAKKSKKDDDEDSKLVANLVASIEARRKIAMDRFINALGIPLIVAASLGINLGWSFKRQAAKAPAVPAAADDTNVEITAGGTR